MEFDEDERREVPDASHDELDEVDFEATMLEVPGTVVISEQNGSYASVILALCTKFNADRITVTTDHYK